MSVLLAVFGEKGYHQYRLPIRRNVDYSIWLSDRIFQMKEPLRIMLENIDGWWYISPSEGYDLKGVRGVPGQLVPGDSFDILSDHNDIYTVTVYDVPSSISPYGKYYTKKEFTVGRDKNNDIIIHDQKVVSRVHARFIRTDRRWVIESSGINGLYVNGTFIKGRAELTFGDCINIVGLKLVFLEQYIAVDTVMLRVSIRMKEADSSPYPKAVPFPTADLGKGDRKDKKDKTDTAGTALVHRSPRSIRDVDDSEVVIDPPPEREVSDDTPMFMSVLSNLLMTLPMVAGSLFMIYASRKEGDKQQLYVYGGLIMAAMSLLSALIWVVIQGFYYRKKDNKRWQQYKEAYRDYLADKDEEIRTRSSGIRSLLMERYIDSSVCLDLPQVRHLLWGRMPYHEDFLDCRLGTGDMEQPVRITEPDLHFSVNKNELIGLMKSVCSKHTVIKDVPIWVSFKENNHIGLVAEGERERQALARSMIVQFAFCNCYTETRIGLIYDREMSSNPNGWSFMRWLPHVWSENREIRLLASNREEARKVFFYLIEVIRKREATGGTSIPAIILFIAAPLFLEGEPVEQYLLQRKNSYGILIVWLTSEREYLPASCECIVEDSGEFQGLYSLTGNSRTAICFDRIEEREADSFARRLSLFRVSERGESSEIPQAVTFFEMMGIEGQEDPEILNIWKKNKVIDSLRAPVGLKAGRKTMYLDIHERYHGPHGLIAGTTGSGKSELLLTYILSLLLMYGPESVNLFLIDYKGGGMSDMFAGMPHLSGQISNLSGGLVGRAMTALRSENLRRQRLFSKYGVNNISAYMKKYYSLGEIDSRQSEYDLDRGHMEPMPHLLIIIDEFAELKKEEPDFMQELISIAQVGRSSGLHLILATQKPGGTVDDKIWSNARFRMCLRVQEKQDSIDMLHKPDAADLAQTGRCCFQVGNDEIYEIFQTGWSGAEYKVEDRGSRSSRILFSGEEDNVPEQEKDKSGSSTQFEIIKELIIKAAARGGYKRTRQLWMEPLPRQIFLSEIAQERARAGRWEVCIGLADDPSNQRQFPAVFSLEYHMVVCGLPMTGKSTLLQTLLYSLVTGVDASGVQIYILDFSNNTMDAFKNMPQVGAVISRDEEAKCQPFFHMAEKMFRERRQLLAGTNYRQYVKTGMKASGILPLPRIILAIDNFSSFNEKTKQGYEDILLTICKEGENVGISLIITCGGFASGELPVNMSQYFKEILCLELKERFSYTEIFGSMIPLLPQKDIKGRGIARFGERILEFQTALSTCSSDDYERMHMIREEADRQKHEFKGTPPPAPRTLPDKAVASDFFEREDVKEILNKTEFLPFGYEIKTAEISYLPLDVQRCLLISGRRKAGKHNLLRILIESLKMKDKASICIIDSSGRMGRYKDDPEIDCYLDGNESARAYLGELGENGQYYIFIEDLYALYSDAAKDEFCLDILYKNIPGEGSGFSLCIIALVNEEEYFMISDLNICQSMSAHATGIHLGGNLAEDMVFEHSGLNYDEQTGILKPGTGYLFMPDYDPVKILIPVMD